MSIRPKIEPHSTKSLSPYNGNPDRQTQSSCLYSNRWQHHSPNRKQSLCNTHSSKVYDISQLKCSMLYLSHRHVSMHKHDSKCSGLYNIAWTTKVLAGSLVYSECCLRIQHEMRLLLILTEVPFCLKLKLSSCVQAT